MAFCQLSHAMDDQMILPVDYMGYQSDDLFFFSQGKVGLPDSSIIWERVQEKRNEELTNLFLKTGVLKDLSLKIIDPLEVSVAFHKCVFDYANLYSHGLNRQATRARLRSLQPLFLHVYLQDFPDEIKKIKAIFDSY